MLRIYRFRIVDGLRVDKTLGHAESPDIKTGNFVYRLRFRDGILEEVDLVTRIPRTAWPRIIRDPTPGVAANIIPNLDDLDLAQAEIRTLQGFLSLFGTSSIDWRFPKVTWEPEDEIEKNELKLFSYSTREESNCPSETVPIDLVIRSILAIRESGSADTPLNFYRKGMEDLRDHAFIDAIYDFYFVLETLYANGKFKSAQVLSEFLGSPALVSAATEALRETQSIPRLETLEQRKRAESILKMDADKLLGHFVKLRGNLHHHSLRDSRSPWHPEEQDKFKPDAYMLHMIAARIALGFIDHLYSQSVIENYDDLRRTQD